MTLIESENSKLQPKAAPYDKIVSIIGLREQKSTRRTESQDSGQAGAGFVFTVGWMRNTIMNRHFLEVEGAYAVQTGDIDAILFRV